MKGTSGASLWTTPCKGPKPRLRKRSRGRRVRPSYWRRFPELNGVEGGSNDDHYTEHADTVGGDVRSHRLGGTSLPNHSGGHGGGGSETSPTFGCPPGD